MAEPAIILGAGLSNARAYLKGVNIPYFRRTDVSRLKYIYTLNSGCIYFLIYLRRCVQSEVYAYPSPRLIHVINLRLQLPLSSLDYYK